MGAVALPKGFKFDPTDEELIINYLGNFSSGKPIPSDFVIIADIYAAEPWNLRLSFDDDGVLYSFTRRTRKYSKGSRPTRTAGQGTWRSYSTEVVINSGGDVVGRKRCFAFDVPDKRSTGWIMYEYELATSVPETSSSVFQEWVLCLIKKSAVSSSSVSRFKASGSTSTTTSTNKRKSSTTISTNKRKRGSSIVWPLPESGMVCSGLQEEQECWAPTTESKRFPESDHHLLMVEEEPSRPARDSSTEEFTNWSEFESDFDVTQFLNGLMFGDDDISVIH